MTISPPDSLNCHICQTPLRVKLCNSKAGKKSVSLSCPADGRHLRAFIADKAYVQAVVVRLATALDAKVIQ